ncbi:PAP2/haloperoxidase-like protein [Gracilaria domingensis]|nr:PAP2/haloperoxidase-like protein [Gracilaria domingensis]
MATYNAWASYHPTAVDIFGRSRFRRPANEHTRDNKNLAVLYALFRVYEESPHSFGGDSGIPVYRELIEELGYDPDDRSTDLTTPIGIGNRAGWDTARLMRIDGWNSEGDLTATQKNYKQFFADYTDYTPFNNPWKIDFPFKWQPMLEDNGRGFFFRQEFVAPYAGSAISFSLSPEEVESRKVTSPYRKDTATIDEALPRDIKTLRRQAKKLLSVSENLTEKERVLAELFDNKAKAFRTEENPAGIASIATAVRFLLVGPGLDLNLDEEIIYGMGSNFASFDSLMTAWKEKRRVDAIRPTGQTMKFLFGNRKFKVWGGPGKKPVMIKAAEWQPYIRTMPHSDIPSGSSCSCTAVVEFALANTKGRDFFPYKFTVPKGSSKFYPGQVPAEDMEIEINHLSEWAELCGQSRLWAGVHFEPAIEAGANLCKGIGQASQNLMDRLVAGEADFTWLKSLPDDVERFWEEE